MRDAVDIVIDPGHGGSDPGAVNGDTREATLNLAAALTLKYYLTQRGMRCLLTRTTDQTVALEHRIAMAERAHARLFLAVHHDQPTAQHAGAYYAPAPGSGELAKAISQAIDPEGWTLPDTASRFGRLYIRDFRGPAVLAELGPTKPTTRDARIHMASMALVPLFNYLRKTEAPA